MTPQPEESPDEILASEIKELREELESIIERLGASYVSMSDIETLSEMLKAKQQDLAMLEAMRAYREAVRQKVKEHSHEAKMQKVEYPELPGICECPICRADRQSDDAIRGMQG